VTAYHEAGHAVARYLIHRKTGAIRRSPFADKEAGAESERLPAHLIVPNPANPAQTGIRPGPYTDEERLRLESELKTTVAASVTEAIVTGRDAVDDVLEDEAQRSDRAHFWTIANSLWAGDPSTRDQSVNRLVREVDEAMVTAWRKVEAVATAYLHSEDGLSADEVERLLK
jgi:hypothetical protein